MVPPAVRRLPLPLLLLGLLLLLGAWLRFTGLNWDGGNLLHPDELHITDVIANRIHAPDLQTILDPDRSSLNPRSVDPAAFDGSNPAANPRPRQFAYGSLPLFVTDFVAWLWGLITQENWTSFWQIFRVGRVLTVLADLGTIILTFGLARRAWGTSVGLLAAAFVTVATMHIQLAHFFVMDTWTTTFITATLWAALVAVQRSTNKALLLTGFLGGCAVATKATVVIVVLPLLVAAWLAACQQQDQHPAWSLRDLLRYFLRACLLLLVAAAVAFFIFEPYAVLNPKIYVRDILEQSAIIGGKIDVPYTRQYIDTLPLLYQIKNLTGWELGPLLGLTVLAGSATALWRTVRQRPAADVVLMTWVAPYLLLLALNEAKFPRYLLAVSPILCGYAAKLLVDLGAFSRSLLQRRRASQSPLSRSRVITSTLLATVVLVGTFLTALAFSAIYQRPHSQITASQWIYDNIPPDSSLSAEYWDRGLPLPLPDGRSGGAYGYKTVTIDFYNDTPLCDRSGGKIPPAQYCRPNNEATLEYLAGKLNDADYLIEATNRIYGSLPHTPWRSPVQEQFFTLLFAGRLGFTLVYDNPSTPALGPWQFDDSFMDESFTVYDHPRVLIFRKDRDLSREELRGLFAPALERPLTPTRYAPPNLQKTLMLPQLVDRLPAVGDYAWSRAWASNSVVATLLWLLAVELLGLLALPLTLWLFGRLPDAGWGLSKLIGWLLLAYPVWLLASLHLGTFTLPIVLAVLLTGVLFAVVALFRWGNYYQATLRRAWRLLLVAEAVFLLVGGLVLIARMITPDLWHTYWGGEKPMELAHLNAILRSANFPPYDPWYADGMINYYYYGQYLVATLVKLTGIPVEIAFNLGLALVGGLIGSTAFSAAAGLTALAQRRPRQRTLAAFGLLGTLLVVGIGNLDGMARIIGRWQDGGPPFRIDNFVWAGSRTVTGAITEFPFFSLLYADLHAHVIALPCTILAITIGVALIERFTAVNVTTTGQTATIFRQAAPLLGLLAVILGAVACTNSWDLPTYLTVVGICLFHALGRNTTRLHLPDLLRQLAVTTVATVGTGALAYLLYYPFFSNFQAQFSQLARTRVPTALNEYIDQFGLFITLVMVVIFAGFCLYLPRLHRHTMVYGGVVFALVAFAFGLFSTQLTAIIASLTPRLLNGPLVAAGTPISTLTPAVLAALLVLLFTLWLLLWGQRRQQLPIALLMAAVGITLVPELFFIADNLVDTDFERMNTVFKFYMQGWTLFALGSVGALAWLCTTQPRWSTAPFHHWRSRDNRRFGAFTLRALIAGLLLMLLLASCAYPLLAPPLRLAVRFPQPPGLGPTLNGYRWMLYGTVPNEYPNTACGGELSFRDDYQAITWLNTQINGTPVLAEASIGPYRGNGSRFAINTGLPTILGWDNHEWQQRPLPGILARSADVRTLYNAPDEQSKLQVLQRYHVSYVIVGAVERHWYYADANRPPCSNPYASAAGLATLEGMAGHYLTPVFQAGETVIYRVLPAAYSSGVAAGMSAPGSQEVVYTATSEVTP